MRSVPITTRPAGRRIQGSAPRPATRRARCRQAAGMNAGAMMQIKAEDVRPAQGATVLTPGDLLHARYRRSSSPCAPLPGAGLQDQQRGRRTPADRPRQGVLGSGRCVGGGPEVRDPGASGSGRAAGRLPAPPKGSRLCRPTGLITQAPGLRGQTVVPPRPRRPAPDESCRRSDSRGVPPCRDFRYRRRRGTPLIPAPIE